MSYSTYRAEHIDTDSIDGGAPRPVVTSTPVQVIRADVRIHPTAEVAELAEIGVGTQIWNNSQIRENVRIGANCIFGKDIYIDFSVHIGDNVKVQNGVYVYHGTTIESDVFIGPGVIFTNDKRPRATTPEGKPKGNDDWEVGEIHVSHGASIGAGAIILPDVRIGRHAMVGAGAVVTHDVPDFALVLGTPARLRGYVCVCGHSLDADRPGHHFCSRCGMEYDLVEVVNGETRDYHLKALHR